VTPQQRSADSVSAYRTRCCRVTGAETERPS
jgi:hypothetical protein